MYDNMNKRKTKDYRYLTTQDKSCGLVADREGLVNLLLGQFVGKTITANVVMV